jgi:hypothetical protein
VYRLHPDDRVGIDDCQSGSMNDLIDNLIDNLIDEGRGSTTRNWLTL